MDDGIPNKKLFTTGEVAELLGMSKSTVSLWCKRGLIRAHKTPGGQYRIPRDEVLRLKKELLG